MSQIAMQTLEQNERVQAELQAAGVSRFGIHRFTSRYLAKVIHPDEHIMAAVFGRHAVTEDLFGFLEGALIATDKRVLFVDRRPGYLSMDEITYDVISGINVRNAGLYSSLTLFTKVKNYEMSFSNKQSVKKFEMYIERRRVTIDRSTQYGRQPDIPSTNTDFESFLDSHQVGVLSTLDNANSIGASVIYYLFYRGKMYFMTRNNSRKALAIEHNHQVTFTVFDQQRMQTAEIRGVVQPETNQQIKTLVSEKVGGVKSLNERTLASSMLELQDKDIGVFSLTPLSISFHNYAQA